jgi:ectoine hydroxylase-related dioxygenase (phytanoyl-CoA dioxygenase family)
MPETSMHKAAALLAPSSVSDIDDDVLRLKRDGYLILRNLAPAAIVAALHEDLRERFEKTPFCKGDFYGGRTKRFGGLLKRSPQAQKFVMHPAVLAIAEAILGPHCDRVQLNLTQALEIHPGECVQAPHRDQDMYRGPHGSFEYLFNVMWPFTPYTAENGATLVYPGSNQRQPAAPYDVQSACVAEMAPGDALVFLGSTLHCAGANRTKVPRTGMLIGYSLGWLKPYENQWLAYPPPIARAFPPELAALVGYCENAPNLGNYEGQCPSILLGDEVPEYLEAVDYVSPEQQAGLAWFKGRQGLPEAA